MKATFEQFLCRLYVLGIIRLRHIAIFVFLLTALDDVELSIEAVVSAAVPCLLPVKDEPLDRLLEELVPRKQFLRNLAVEFLLVRLLKLDALLGQLVQVLVERLALNGFDASNLCGELREGA